ncbi:hypothetical protein [Pseudolysinimonas sp.]|uniref:hypothetical protein n=1 Tax=Pseudolysinimonas sp. TaxID=2680009 RepID=UPI003F81E5A0
MPHTMDEVEARIRTAAAEDPQALVQLRGYLDTWIRHAEFPKLFVVEPDTTELTARRERVEEAFNAAKGHDALDLAAELDVIDEELARTPWLRCPVCGDDVDPDSLFAVDEALRETAATRYDSEGYPLVEFDYDGDADFDGLYYRHGDTRSAHAVRLPDGWHEA